MLSIFDRNLLPTNLTAILVANGVGICLMLVVLFGSRRRLRMVSVCWQMFHWMCWSCLILCLLETAAFLLDGQQFAGARHLALTCNTVAQMLAVLVGFLWTCFVDYKLLGDLERLKKRGRILIIPALLICVLLVCNLFADVFFGLDDNNIYYRTSLFAVPWVVVYGYMAYSAVLSYRHRKRVDQYLFMPILIFLLPVYVGSLLQMFFYGISLVWVSLSLGLIYLYINLQNEEMYLDPLTRLYNRNYLVHYMDHLVQQGVKKAGTAGIMLDIDDFKYVNDTYGHSEGDAVLRAVGALLHRAAAEDAVVIRYGGDEFVILLVDAAPERLQAVRERIRQEREALNAAGTFPFSLSFSTGLAKFDTEDVYGLFQEMDRRMYEEKRRHYQKREQEASAADDTKAAETQLWQNVPTSEYTETVS